MAKPLCEHDIQEILKFQQYLADKNTMPKREFYRKYQDYMGLTDAERKVLAAEEDSQHE